MPKRVALYTMAFLLSSTLAHAGGLAEQWVEPEAADTGRKERCPHVAGIFHDNPACLPPRRGGDGGGQGGGGQGSGNDDGDDDQGEDPGTGGGGT